MKEIDWANLSFGYMRTDYNVRINFRNGKWGELEVSSEEYLNLHMAATSVWKKMRRVCNLPARESLWRSFLPNVLKKLS